ncbi:MAG: hypothetical protein RR416_06720, partial [Clostridia bacterium]
QTSDRDKEQPPTEEVDLFNINDDADDLFAIGDNDGNVFETNGFEQNDNDMKDDDDAFGNLFEKDEDKE